MQENGNRALLGAIAAFFDRFAGSNLMGTLCFSMGPVSRPGESYLNHFPVTLTSVMKLLK